MTAGQESTGGGSNHLQYPNRPPPAWTCHAAIGRLECIHHPEQQGTMTLSEPSTRTSQATGLPEAAIRAIQQVLASHTEVQEAILYGSRALGRHRPASDIDLTLLGSDLNPATLARIDADLDDLLLP